MELDVVFLVNNLDEYYNQVKLLGAKILMEPKDETWDCKNLLLNYLMNIRLDLQIIYLKHWNN